MRLLLPLVLLFFHFNSFAQFKESDYHCRRDSVIHQTSYGSVYITRDHQCEFYNWLCPEPKEWMNSNEIIKNFPELKGACSPNKSIGSIPRYWNSLYEYKGQYYVYGPNDLMINHPELISDSFLIGITSDFYYFSIKEHDLVNPHEVRLTLDLNGDEAQLRIRLLTFPEGASLWEYTMKNGSWSEIKVSSDYVRTYDMINNDCVNQKCFQEFHFHQTDLSRLKFMD